jgi:type IV secretion system protein VirD4
VIQTPAQLREVYGMHNSEVMLKSLAARIVFAPKDFADAKEISDELGFTTVPVRTVSKPLGASLDKRGQRSRSQSVSLQRRALLLPQEVKELGQEEAIVFYEGCRPIRCRKIRYFTDRRFRKRLMPAPEVLLPPRPGMPAIPQPSKAASPALVMADGAGAAASAAAAVEGKTESVGVREATFKDIERIESLTLEDFETDFSKVQIPDKEGPLSQGEMKIAVESFLTSLERT